jgi:hypothetical protein
MALGGLGAHRKDYVLGVRIFVERMREYGTYVGVREGTQRRLARVSGRASQTRLYSEAKRAAAAREATPSLW